MSFQRKNSKRLKALRVRGIPINGLCEITDEYLLSQDLGLQRFATSRNGMLQTTRLDLSRLWKFVQEQTRRENEEEAARVVRLGRIHIAQPGDLLQPGLQSGPVHG